MGPGKTIHPTPPTCVSHPASLRAAEGPPTGGASASPAATRPAPAPGGGLRLPSGFRGRHVTSTKRGGRGGGKPRQGWDLGPRGAAPEEETRRDGSRRGRAESATGRDGGGEARAAGAQKLLERGEREARGRGGARAGRCRRRCGGRESAGRQRPACRARRAARPLLRKAGRRGRRAPGMSQGLPAAGSVPPRSVAAPGNQSQPQVVREPEAGAGGAGREDGVRGFRAADRWPGRAGRGCEGCPGARARTRGAQRGDRGRRRLPGGRTVRIAPHVGVRATPVPRGAPSGSSE